MSSSPLLSIQQVGKQFGQVTALRFVTLTLEKGRVYGLAGENGAGKSTLVKILCGVHRASDGQIFLDGQLYAPRNPSEAEGAGLSVFHQEIPICPNLSVAANVFLGPRLPSRGVCPDWKAMENRCEQLFREWLGTEIDAQRPMRECTVAERQLALLVRVLTRNARLIILDEPTTALTPSEVSNLFAIIRRLKSQGITFLFVSHLLDELMELSDEVYVLRDGSLVGHLERGPFDSQTLSQLIAGRTLAPSSPTAPIKPAAPKLDVRALALAGAFREVSFQLRPGEILGITGLQGSGRSALARALFAAPPADKGEIFLNGARLAVKTPRDAIQAGIGYVPEDRKSLGLFGALDIQTNLGIVRLDSLARFGLLPRPGLRQLALEMQDKLLIKLSATDAPIASLSGGNQQKVLISRWLAIRPEVLVMNEPTRGVDVGAKDEICRLVRSLAEEGNSFIVSSSDLDELIQLADRILVMNSGRVTAEFSRAEASKQGLIQAVGSSRRDS